MIIGLIGAKGKLGSEIAKLTPCIPIEKNTSRQNLNCDVLIDVSSHLCLEENFSANIPMVIGTTGHKNFSLINEKAKTLPIFYASNFSLGAHLLLKTASFIQEHFPADIDLIEMHHTEKKDSPSGTALHILKNLHNAKVHSIRSGKALGEHTLLFNNPEEKITLSHQVHSRSAFAKGAIQAAHFIAQQKPGLYGMDNLLAQSLSLSPC